MDAFPDSGTGASAGPARDETPLTDVSVGVANGDEAAVVDDSSVAANGSGDFEVSGDDAQADKKALNTRQKNRVMEILNICFVRDPWTSAIAQKQPANTQRYWLAVVRCGSFRLTAT
jgi:hypothetical protein